MVPFVDTKTEGLRAAHDVLAEFYAERLAGALDRVAWHRHRTPPVWTAQVLPPGRTAQRAVQARTAPQRALPLPDPPAPARARLSGRRGRAHPATAAARSRRRPAAVTRLIQIAVIAFAIYTPVKGLVIADT
jgi:hypothetical protein